MCLIVFALDCRLRYRLVLAANRDEYFSRPTSPADFWTDAPQVLAGRDLEAGGTWLGVTTSGKLAALTYYREPITHVHLAPSRGKLVADFLAGTMTPEEYLEQLKGEEGCYGGFNLLFGAAGGLYYHTNRGDVTSRVAAGIHGLSNGLLDTPWPKVSAARERLGEILREENPDPDNLFGLLGDRQRYPDPLLPDTGVGIERERHLSPVFIAGNEYGTRSSTLVLVGRDNRMVFRERTFDNLQRVTDDRAFTIQI